MKKLLILIVSTLTLLVTGCADNSLVHKIDIQQGNILNQEDVNQLKLGMNKRKVVYILGSPSISDPFHQQRWDYVYTLKKGDGNYEKKNVTLYFKSNILDKIDGSIMPQTNTAGGSGQYKKQQIITVNPKPIERPGFLKRIWISFFGDEEDLKLLDE